MTTLQRLKHEARRAEQRSDWRRAIALYRDALRLDEQTGATSDLSLWNRIGDLHMRLGEVPAAVQCYENAADRYADHDLPTSAIAICNKILRIDPGRDVVYRRLGLLHAATGLTAEGRAACLQFVERALAREAVAEALEAVQEYEERTGDERIRPLAAELLETAGRHDEARAQRTLAGTEGDDATAAGAGPASARPPAEDVSARPPATGSEPLDGAIRNRLGIEAPGPEPDPVAEEDDFAAASPVEAEIVAAVRRFRNRLQDALVEAAPEVRYDLGVAFATMGLRAEAARELRAGIAAPGRLRAAHTRLTSLSRTRSEDLPAPATAAPGLGDAPEARGLPEVGDGGKGPGPSPGEPSADAATLQPEGDAEDAGLDLQSQFFRARLAQYRVRQAEGRHETDFRAHLDLGAAFAAMGLAEEAFRELIVALDGRGSIAAEAASLLEGVAGDPETDPRIAAAVRARLRGEAVAEGGGPSSADGVGGAEGRSDGSPSGSSIRTDADDAGTVDALLSGIEEAARAPAVRPTVPADTVPPPRARDEAIDEADELLAAGRADEAATRLYEALERHEAERSETAALRVLDRLLDLRPDDVLLHHQKAEYAMMVGDRASLTEAYEALAATLLRQGAPRSARTVYARLLEVDPEHAEARESLTRLRAESGRDLAPRRERSGGDATGAPPTPSRAAGSEFDALLEELRDEGPAAAALADDPEAHYELGIAFKQMEMWDEALAELERSLHGLADPRPALEASGECLVRLGRPGQALDVLADAEALYPEGPDRARLGVMLWKAEALAGLDRNDEACDVLRRIVAVDPDFRDAARRLSALSR